MLAYVQWMTPAWVWALPVAVLLPLVVHLLSQRGGKLAYFPAVRFVKKAVALQTRWYRPRHWLMLLIRMLILAAVIGALAQPIWWRDPAAASQNYQGVAAVLILDASASMQRTEQGSSLFEIARAQTIAALSSLDPSRDRAMVIVMDASPSPILPRMSANFSAMADELRTLKPTWEHGDLTAALTLAARPPWDPNDKAATALLNIHLFSDMQKTQWPGEAQLRTILADKTFIPQPVGQAKSVKGNLALHRASVTPSQPVPGQRVTVWADVANYADANSPPVNVNVVMVAAGQRQVRMVKVAAGGTARVSFLWQPREAGTTYVSLTLEPAVDSAGNVNALTADDHTGRFVQVARSRKVALVTAADVDDPSSSPYYFKRALTPDKDPSANDVHLQVLTPAMLAGTLSPSSSAQWPACIVMTMAGGPPQAALDALAAYMNQGGGVWWIIDSAIAATSLANWQSELGSLAPVVNAQNPTQTLPLIMRIDGMPTIGSGAFDDPALEVFEGPARSALLQQTFTATFEGTLAPGAKSLLSFKHLLTDDASNTLNLHPPLLASLQVGQGQLVVMTAMLSPDASPLVKGQVFVPLVHQIVRTLSPLLRATSNPLVGSSLSIDLPVPDGATDAAAGLYVLKPDGSRITQIVLDPPMPGQTSSVQLPTISRDVGRYSLHVKANDQLLGGVQVELASSESDLTPWQLANTSAAHSPLASPATTDDSEHVITTPQSRASQAADQPLVVSDAALREHGQPLWPYLLLLAVLLLILESLLGGLASAVRAGSQPPNTSLRSGGQS